MPAGAGADVFNGRIAFSSFRTSPVPGQPIGDIFSVNPDGTGLKQLTTNPLDDAQSDCAPDGRNIAYRIRKPDGSVNYEVSRMTAQGTGHLRLTYTPTGEASAQPSWKPDGSGILFRYSAGRISDPWTMGLFGEHPKLLFQIPEPSSIRATRPT